MSTRRSCCVTSLLWCSLVLLGCPNDLPGVAGGDVTRRDAGPLDPVNAGSDAGPVRTCEPKDCTDLGATCGAVPDGCGAVLDCGSCSAPNLCGGGGVPNQCGFVRPACEPLTCDDYDYAECGYVADGCGDVVLCDTDCSETFQTCGGGGEPNQCGGPIQSSEDCPALLTCDDVGATCGLIGNGCGGVLDCGSCSAPYTCGGGGVPSQCGLRDPTPSPSCGDGTLDVGEACDDGNQLSGDGCTRDCINIEPGYRCDTAGAACVATVQCGDGLIAGSEVCDDGNEASGDGCTATCQREPGYNCPTPGAACRAARCGDSIVAGFEECDDGAGQAGDGCSADCLLEEGFRCDVPGQACVTTTCGDGVREGAEDCDDGNFNTGDGCSPLCTFEPVCSGGTCEERCGDGLKLGNEGCDDGNTRDGDGCSSTCTIEPGFTCSEVSEVPVLPIVYRDFIGTESGTKLNLRPGDSGPLHLDFEKYPLQGDTDYRCTFQVQPALVDGKPVLEDPMDCVDNASTFAQWYRSDDQVNRTMVDQLLLTAVAGQSGAYEFFDSSFFPVTGKGWNAPDCLPGGGVCEQTRQAKLGTTQFTQENFHFTSETRYWFTYRGGEKLTFDGDDDVWVFIDGKLAVDINGLHPAIQRFIQLPDPNDVDPNAPLNGRRGSKDPIIQNGEIISYIDDIDTGTAAQWVTDPMALGLVPGNIYEVAVFHAERHTDKSQYRLTLQNFLSGRSTCEWTCGDGVATRFEVCDDGTANNTGAYGKCNADCL
ncbi:MAG: DUF4215 domain-containing protein, partial [Myxococcota bacterium]